MPDPSLRRWSTIGLSALAVIVVTVPLSQLRAPRWLGGDAALGAEPQFVGAAACRDCHTAIYERWLGSDHDLAMAEATEDSVRGDFNNVELTAHGVTSSFFRRDDGAFMVRTEGPGGATTDFEITHTFGFEPLQQYLTPFPGGRLQALHLAWDTERQRWFHLYPDLDIPPDDWLHWTRNGQNWNGMCAECHSTNLIKGYDPDTESYHTTWSDIDVACEACHGAGSRHVAWARIPPMGRPELANAGLVVDTSSRDGAALVELCAPCHSRRAELGDYNHSGGELLDAHLPSLLVEGLYHADGQILDEVYVYGSFVQSKMYAREVSCRDCHDSHSLELHRDGNELCLQCHQREVYDSPAHHFHKKVHEGRPSDGALCVTCHMPESLYMVVDWRADHSFRLPRPDLSAELGTPNACTQGGCHDDRPLSWSLEAYRRWYGQARRPHYGTTFAMARRGAPAAGPELVRLAENPLQPSIVRATALELLEAYPGDDAARVLRASIMDAHALLRRTAAAAVGVPDATQLVELLAPLLADPVQAVRLAAASRLAGVPAELLKPYQREALARGIDEYRSALGYSLDFAASGMSLGNLYTSLGDAAQAERSYRLALKIDDLFYPAKMNLAVLLSGQGRNDEAEQLLREVLVAYPGNPDAAYSLGLLLAEMSRPEEAVAQLELARDAWPTNGRVRYNLGLLLQQLGRPDDAWRMLDAALALEPDNPSFLVAAADHLLRRGRFDEALVLARRLIAAHPDRPEGRQLEAVIRQATAGGAG